MPAQTLPPSLTDYHDTFFKTVRVKKVLLYASVRLAKAPGVAISYCSPAFLVPNDFVTEARRPLRGECVSGGRSLSSDQSL